VLASQGSVHLHSSTVLYEAGVFDPQPHVVDVSAGEKRNHEFWLNVEAETCCSHLKTLFVHHASR